jgi:hypothetical protein
MEYSDELDNLHLPLDADLGSLGTMLSVLEAVTREQDSIESASRGIFALRGFREHDKKERRKFLKETKTTNRLWIMLQVAFPPRNKLVIAHRNTKISKYRNPLVFFRGLPNF